MAYVLKKNWIDDYYNWILSTVGIRKRKYTHYKKLLKTLFSIPYTWTNEMDENRYSDGMGLRYHFCDENDLSDYQWKDFYFTVNFRCSVLEVLTAFSRRIADSPYTYDEFSGMMFWVFMENLGLTEYRDEVYDEDAVKSIIIEWMSGEKTGKNCISILPISDKSVNSDEMDLWMTMTCYMSEHPELSE